MTRSKRLALGTLAALALAALAFGLVVALMPASPERVAYERIQVGMTRDAVTDLFGDTNVTVLTKAGKRVGGWQGRDWFIIVEFDQDDRVTGKSFRGLGWFASARDWLARAWQ